MKLKEITPSQFLCHKKDCCPAVYDTGNDSYVIVGKMLPASVLEQIKNRVGDDELVIEVPRGMIDGLK